MEKLRADSAPMLRAAEVARKKIAERVSLGPIEEAACKKIVAHVFGEPTASLPQPMSFHDCLPFPAGPIVPRYWTEEQPALGPITTGQRCELAVTLLAHDYLAVNERADVVTRRVHGGLIEARGTPMQSALTKLSRLAFREWYDRHPAVTTEQDGAGALNCMLYTIGSIASAGEPGYIDEVLKYRDKFSRAIRHERRKLLDRSPLDRPAFGSRSVWSECHECRCPDFDSPERHPRVESLLRQRDGQWRLLSGLFLNQLHSLLVWHGDTYGARGSDKGERSTLHAAVLRMLGFIAAGDGVGSLEAIGLLSVLSRLEGFAMHSGNGVPVLTDVPPCFVPGAIGDTDEALADCLRYLANHPQTCSMASNVASLAQELAAALTDPAFVRHADVTSAACTQYVNHYDHTRPALKGLQEFRRARGLWWALPRNTRLRAYFNWMKDRGLSIALSSSHCLQAPACGPLMVVANRARTASP